MVKQGEKQRSSENCVLLGLFCRFTMADPKPAETQSNGLGSNVRTQRWLSPEMIIYMASVGGLLLYGLYDMYIVSSRK